MKSADHFAVILLTDRQTDRMTDKPVSWSHNLRTCGSNKIREQCFTL